MPDSRFSALLVSFLGGLLLLFFVGTLLPSWQGSLFGGQASVDFDASLLGQWSVNFAGLGWGWDIFSPLPFSLQIIISNASSLEAGSIWPLITKTLGSLLLFLAFGAALFGAIFKSRKVALLTFSSSLVLLFMGAVCSLALVSFSEPKHINQQSEAIWAIQEDFWRPVRPVRELSVPGQELVMPGSPYYGGEIVCVRGSCQPQRALGN